MANALFIKASDNILFLVPSYAYNKPIKSINKELTMLPTYSAIELNFWLSEDCTQAITVPKCQMLYKADNRFLMLVTNQIFADGEKWYNNAFADVIEKYDA
ncbi:hypothetical protein ACFBZI_12075, partial [Moraxella sp. ZJ142]